MRLVELNKNMEKPADSQQPEMVAEAKSEDALAAPSCSVYRFSTFQELVDRVPGDRIRDCMEELGTVLATAKLSTQLTYAVACNLAKADGKELPPEPAQIIVLPPEFEWMDDGKRELEARMVDAKGDGLFAVKITPNAKLRHER